MAEPEKVDTSSQPVAAGVKPLLYKCLLNQQAQKLWKEPPIYQTHNEGSDHLPKFRTTVWINGENYTSPNTFQQRKMAEMDASKIAYSATIHKLKNEASHLVHEDKTFCKSILVEYAARMNIQKPVYQTIQLDTPVPVFRSSLDFNGVSCMGDDSKNKKEAEQSTARAVILKYLDSESGNIMSEIVKCKFKHYAEMKNNVVVQVGFDNGLTLNEAKREEMTKMPIVQGVTIHVDVNQTRIPEVSANVVETANSEATSVIVLPPAPLSSPALAQTMCVSSTSSKKRNRKNKKNAQKKMRLENQLPIPAIALSQVPPSSVAQSSMFVSSPSGLKAKWF